MKIDPCVIISLIGLLVFIPLTFTIDHLPYEGNCSEPPILYLQDELGKNSSQFAEFCESAQKSILIFARTLMPIGPDEKTWIEPLRKAVKRGVHVEILTSQVLLKKYFNFTTIILTNKRMPNTYASFAIADTQRLIYTSQLFGVYSSKEADYYIDFKKCKSIVSDATEIFNFYKAANSQDNLTLFPHYYCAGFSYPTVHKTCEDDAYSFGISPPIFVSPGRKSTIDDVREFFSESKDTNISVFTTSMFPEINQTGDDVPELIMSDQIETAASLNNITIRILMSSDQYAAATNTTRSLSQIPNVITGIKKVRETSPSFFIRDDLVIFMPMSFEAAISLDIASLSLKMKNKAISEKISKHFEDLWESNSTTILS